MPIQDVCELLGRHDLDDDGKCTRCGTVRVMLEQPTQASTALDGLWVVRREQGPYDKWLWWCAKSSGYTSELVRAGLYGEADAKTHQRLRVHNKPELGYDHKAYPSGR